MLSSEEIGRAREYWMTYQSIRGENVSILFDTVDALRDNIRALEAKVERLTKALETIDYAYKHADDMMDFMDKTKAAVDDALRTE